MSELQTKKAANYRDGTFRRKCGNCSMFRPFRKLPSTSTGSCTAVQGIIDPGALCDLWEKKK